MNDSSDMNQRTRHVRRSADQWAQLIDAQSTSGLSIAAFCREHGLAANSFHRWRRRLEASAVAGSTSRAFVRLRTSTEGTTDGDSSARQSATADTVAGRPVVVRFVDGVELHVDGERLGEVLTLLRDAAPAGGIA